MSPFIDTSALLALLDHDDANHGGAAAAFAGLLEAGLLVTHNYVLVEAVALTQARLGPTAVRSLLTELLPAIDTVWVEEGTHRAAVSALLAAGRRRVSLVDWVSFEILRVAGIERAFAFDRDFAEQGFTLVP